jgi:undecaprenyl-phosphate galactose phosphotransferase/putative colanic acid biosynthesis UDP-glucose lipid carrier transferase
MLNIIYPFSLWIRYGNIQKLNDTEVKTIWLYSNIVWLFLVIYKKAYKLFRVERIENLLGRTLQIFLFHSTVIAISIIILNYDDISRLRILIFFVIFYFNVSLYLLQFFFAICPTFILHD